MRNAQVYNLKYKKEEVRKMGKGRGGKPSTTGNPSGGGRDNNPPKGK